MKTRIEINHQLLENQRNALRACMTVDGDMGKQLREAIFQELKAARDKIVEQIRFDNGDPRGTAHAVKRYIAGKYLGGVLSIANGKASGGVVNNYEPFRKLRPGQRGGNRRPRSERTKKMMSYGPSDREFILRFVNSGTKRRAIEKLTEFKKAGGGSRFKWVQDPSRYGNRGSIQPPRDFFGRLGTLAIEEAINNLGQMVDEEFERLLKE